MSNESSTTKLILPTLQGNSTSTTPTSSSPPPLSLNGDQQQQQQLNINGNGILNDGKFTSNHYHNGVLSDLQATFQNSSWSHGLDPLSSVSGDHSFDIPNGNRMFDPQTTSPAPLMTMQQQLSYQQVCRSIISLNHHFLFYFIGHTTKTNNSCT